MYKVYYYIDGSKVYNKSFPTFAEATDFAIKRSRQQRESVLEIKYYDDVDHKKPDRN